MSSSQLHSNPPPPVNERTLKAVFDLVSTLRAGGYRAEDIELISRFFKSGSQKTVMLAMRALFRLTSANQQKVSGALHPAIPPASNHNRNLEDTSNQGPSATMRTSSSLSAASSPSDSSIDLMSRRTKSLPPHLLKPLMKRAYSQSTTSPLEDEDQNMEIVPRNRSYLRDDGRLDKKYRRILYVSPFMDQTAQIEDAELAIAAWGSMGLPERLTRDNIARHSPEALNFIHFFTDVASRVDDVPSDLWAQAEGLRSVALRLVQQMNERRETNIGNLRVKSSSRFLVCHQFGQWYQNVRKKGRMGKFIWANRQKWPQELWVLWVFAHLVYQSALAIRNNHVLPGDLHNPQSSPSSHPGK